MAEYRANPTWAILLPSDLPEGSEAKVVNMLGSVVADFEHPLHEIIWRPIAGKEQGLKGTMKVEDEDFHSIMEGLTNAEVKVHLTQAVRGVFASGQKNEQQMSAKTVITRTLENHRRFFDEIDKQSHDAIVRMIKKNPRSGTPYALMIVGIKSCIDARISSKTQLSSHIDASVNIPLDEALKAAGVVAPIGANVDLGMLREKISGVLNEFWAKGERVFAIQYRRISIRRTMKVLPIPHTQRGLKYNELIEIPANRGLFGADEKIQGGNDVRANQCRNSGDGSGKFQNVETGEVLELGDGMEPGLSKSGAVYITAF